MNGAGNETETINGTVNLEPDATAADASELVAEMAALSVINEHFTALRNNVQEWFLDLKDTSEEGNPVRTHLAIQSLEEEVITEICALWDTLRETLANRSEQIPEKGGLLRKQVVGEED